MQISVVIALFNEEESLPELKDWIVRVMDENNFTYEIIFVDDGSTDGSWNLVEQFSKENPNIKGIKFRRNYGKSAALNRGFAAAQGDVVITMDADLQDSPDEIPELYRMIVEDGFDLVSGWKKDRKDPFLSKNLPSKVFNFVTSIVSGLRLHDYNCGLKVYRKEVVKVLKIYGEMHRYIPVLAHWEGFRVTEIPVKHHKRKYGISKYGWSRFINGFLDLLTVFFLNKYTKRPLHFFGLIGTFFLIIGLAINFYFLGIWLIEKHLHVRPLLVLGIFLILLAVQFYSIGLIGELVIKDSRSLEEYDIKEKIE